MHILQLQQPLPHYYSQLQERLNQQPPKPLPQPPALHHAKKLINDYNPWNETSTKNDKLELLKFKLCSNNSIKNDSLSNENDKLALLILNESNPWNETSTKNDKLELLKFQPCSNNSIKNDSLFNENDKLELLILNDSKLCSNNSIKNDSLSNKNDKLESLPKTPSATSKLKVLPDA